ncbi:hypothetical protein Hanom_Chr15g01390411 [Helianthus anomalus]
MFGLVQSWLGLVGSCSVRVSRFSQQQSKRSSVRGSGDAVNFSQLRSNSVNTRLGIISMTQILLLLFRKFYYYCFKNELEPLYVVIIYV